MALADFHDGQTAPALELHTAAALAATLWPPGAATAMERTSNKVAGGRWPPEVGRRSRSILAPKDWLVPTI
jgi:hypothetical protein